MEVNVSGSFADGKSSRTEDARLLLADNGLVTVESAEGNVRIFANIDLVEVSSRLGNVPRTIRFPDESRFITDDNDAVDHYLSAHQPQSTFLHSLESHLGWVLGASAFTIVFIVLFVWKGIPAIAESIAYQLPDSVVAEAGKGSLDLLDRLYLSESKLGPDEKLRIDGVFAKHLKPSGVKQVVYRAWHGPNAFALPDGTLVFTDELVELASVDEELLAVLFHEIGHVQHRHFMRRVIQSSIFTISTLLVFGDLETADLVLGVPTVLLDAAYSREFELEADSYALAVMQSQNIDPAYFGSIMRKIEAAYENPECVSAVGNETQAGIEACDETAEGGGQKLLQYLSTHPLTEERIRLMSVSPSSS